MDKIKKRLGIFCFFDSEGIVDLYVENLLSEFCKVLTELVIVVNGYVNDAGYKNLEKYSKYILIRENKGFDIGAIKYGYDYWLNYHNLYEFDELIFCNDTFYGPFIPFIDIFEKMEREDSDFWGINLVENGMLTHIQSYFMVINNKDIILNALNNYFCDSVFNMLIDSNNIADIYACYELGLFRYLIEKGYKYSSYTNTHDADIYQNPDRCIFEYNLPILKKKCFSPSLYNIEVMKNTLKLIRNKYHFDMRYIEENAIRQYKIDLDSLYHSGLIEKQKKIHIVKKSIVNEDIILEFITSNPDIYIYGTGVYARKVWLLFHDKIINFKGFIISDNQNRNDYELYGKPIMYYSEVNENSSIIIGCDSEHTKQICTNMHHLGNVCVLWKSQNDL